MTRYAGDGGRLYAAIASGGTAEPLVSLNTWTLDQSTDRFETTSFEDATKTFVSGKPNATGTYGGFYDDASAQFFTAAVDGVARKTYLYPRAADGTKYWFGTAFFDESIETAVGSAVSVTGSFAAATPFAKIG